MGAKIETKTQTYEKKDMLKLMLKFDALKNQKNARINRPWSRQGSISVAYGNIPAPGLERRVQRIRCLVLSSGILLKGFQKANPKNNPNFREHFPKNTILLQTFDKNA